MNDDPLKIKEGCGSCCLFLFAVFVLGPIVLVLLGMSNLLKLPTMDFSTIIIVGVGFGLWLFVMCELGQAKKRKEEAALKDASLDSTPAPASSSAELASSKLEALRKYLAETGFGDNDPLKTSFSLWMTKGDVNGQAEFVVKSVDGHLNVSGAGDVDTLREDLAKLWLARDKEQVLGWLQSHERQEVSLIVKKTSSVAKKPEPPTTKTAVRFFIFKPGEEEAQGPFDISQIEALRVCGVVNEDTQFCREGENEWMPSPVE